MSTRLFDLGDILSITSGRLVSRRHIGGVYDILNWMTGDDLMTHQLPRASRECEPFLLAEHPDLANIVIPDGLDTEQKVAAFLDGLIGEYGDAREVTPLNEADHTHINPLTELSMIRPDAEVIVVQVPPKP